MRTYGLGVGAYLVGCYDSRKERDGYPGQSLRPGAGRWRLTCTEWTARISHPGRKMGIVLGMDNHELRSPDEARASDGRLVPELQP